MAHYRDIESIKFSIGSLDEGLSIMVLTRHGDSWVCATAMVPYDGESGQEMLKARVLDAPEAEKLEADVNGSGMLGWAGAYRSPIKDGITWDLQVELAGDRHLSSGGANKWPSGFNALYNALVALGLPGRFEDFEGRPENTADFGMGECRECGSLEEPGYGKCPNCGHRR